MNCTADSKISSFLKFILFIWHKGMTDPQADVLQNRLWPHSYTETKKKKKKVIHLHFSSPEVLI